MQTLQLWQTFSFRLHPDINFNQYISNKSLNPGLSAMFNVIEGLNILRTNMV